jgi:hypothetical protein
MTETPKYVVEDPRVDLNETTSKFFVSQGIGDQTQIYQPTNSYSNSNITFPIILPNNNNCVIDRSSLILSVPVTITLSSTGAGSGNVYQPLRMGLKSNALWKMTQSLTMNLSSNNVSYYPSSLINAMERYEYCNINTNLTELEPEMLDYSANYSDLYNSNASSFSTFASSSYPFQRSRNCINGSDFKVISNTTTQAVIEVVLRANMSKFPPFSDTKNIKGINLTPFTIVLNLQSGSVGSLIWGYDSDISNTGINAISVNIGSNSLLDRPSASFTTIQTNELPNVVDYPYNFASNFPITTSNAIASNTQVTKFQSTTLQLDGIPSRIYIYITNSLSSRLSSYIGSTYPDTFAQINGISITFDNKSNLLANLNMTDLYRISKYNGFNGTYNDWVGSTSDGTNIKLAGSVLCIDPIRDLSIDTNSFTSTSKKFNFQFLISFLTLSPYTTLYDVVCIPIYDGIMSVHKSGSVFLSTNPVTDTSQLIKSPYSYRDLIHMYGGDQNGGNAKQFFKDTWGKLKDAAQTTNDILKKTQIASNVISRFAPGVGNVVKNLGYGSSMAGNFYAGPPNNIQNEGGWISQGSGILAGGRQITKKELYTNAKKYY